MERKKKFKPQFFQNLNKLYGVQNLNFKKIIRGSLLEAVNNQNLLVDENFKA